jgi:hypothetical protein
MVEKSGGRRDEGNMTLTHEKLPKVFFKISICGLQNINLAKSFSNLCEMNTKYRKQHKSEKNKNKYSDVRELSLFLIQNSERWAGM